MTDANPLEQQPPEEQRRMPAEFRALPEPIRQAFEDEYARLLRWARRAVPAVQATAHISEQACQDTSARLAQINIPDLPAGGDDV
jgi:hypothetical protein